jgi:hypothetical protein
MKCSRNRGEGAKARRLMGNLNRNFLSMTDGAVNDFGAHATGWDGSEWRLKNGD